MNKLNIFNLAEKQLRKENAEGIIPCFTGLDVIEYAIKIRGWLDKNSIPKAIKLTKEEKKRNHRVAQKRYELNRSIKCLLKRKAKY